MPKARARGCLRARRGGQAGHHPVLGRRGGLSRFHQPGGDRLVAGRALRVRCWHPASTSAGTTTTNTRLPDEDATCDGFGTPVPLELVRPIQALLMTRATLERQRAAKPGGAAVHRHPRRLPRHPALRPDLERGQRHRAGTACAGTSASGCSMSLSGMLNTGHDVGGFSGPVPDAELLIRWTQAGAAPSAFHHEFLEARRRLHLAHGCIRRRRRRSARRSACATG